MEDFLNIVEQKEEVQIDAEKLRFIASKVTIWDHYGISRSQCVSLSEPQKVTMLKAYYKNLLPVYFGDGKKSFCCSDCVWFDYGRKQDCLRCGVNVMTFSCFEFSSAPKQPSNELSMQSVEGIFKKQEEDLLNMENGVKYGLGSYSALQNLVKGNINLKV